MRTHTDYLNTVVHVVRRTLEGRISPLNFLLILGFFSSLVLLYISLHVHYATISENIHRDTVQREKLIEEKIYLTAEHNKLTSPERIIPLVRELGLRAGQADEVTRVAYYRNQKEYSEPENHWAQSGIFGSITDLPGTEPEN